ncbi:transketolase [Candidatus Micrarchaeota archaeon]|nr:transketolase [Candidatus Micrarchaeota archaeon]
MVDVSSVGTPLPLIHDSHTLQATAARARAYALLATHFAGSGHPGGSLSVMDVETALYFGVMRHDPSNPYWPARDRLFVSGQHKCPAQYAVMGLAGYFAVEDFAAGLRLLGSPFQGHPDWLKLPGIEMSGGSLGQGLSVAVGSALAARLDGAHYRVFCIMGDGEQQEGSVWEAAMSAAHYGLDNLCAVVDCNGLQIDGRVDDVMPIAPLADKYRAFGWHVFEVDGHDFGQLLDAFSKAAESKGKPSVILARTSKGKGVSFMQDQAGWHGKAPNDEQLKAALCELGLSSLLTPQLVAKAKAARDAVAREYGTLVPPTLRPHWWNTETLMKAEFVPTRKGFGKSLSRIGADERIVALGADISESICIYDFCKDHPDRKARFLSMGIAEQNMTTVAAGLAKEGKIPIIGSYGVFVTGRNWDQLRTTVCYGNLNVKVAVGHGGISVGPDGATHQSLEDLALLAVLPNMTVLSPCDACEAERATESAVLQVRGPAAIRFAREATPVITDARTPFVLGLANVYRFTSEAPRFSDAFDVCLSRDFVPACKEDVVLVSSGPEFAEALRAAYILEKDHGIRCRVINLHTLKPLDEEAIRSAARDVGCIVTAEEHQVGMLGNLVAGVCAKSAIPVKMAMVGVPDRFGESAQPWELVWKYGLAAEHIANEALQLLEKTPREPADSVSATLKGERS